MEWMHAGVIYSYGFCLCRVVLAVLMGVGVVAHVYLNTPSPKWLIYMTDQVMMLSNSLLDNNSFPGNHPANYSLCSSCISGPLVEVQVNIGGPLIPHSRRPMSDGRTLPFLYKLSWGLEVAFRTFCEVHPSLRTWCLPLPFSSQFSTGPFSTLLLWSMAF